MPKTFQNRRVAGKIKDNFEKANLNFDEIDRDLDELYFMSDENYNALNQKIDTKDSEVNTRMTAHAQGEAENHTAGDVTFAPTPTIPEEDVQKAIEKVDERVGNIVANSGTSDSETVDARNSSRYGVFPNLKARLDAHENASMPNLLYNAQDGKYYKYGEQISAEGKPQLIFEEV